MFAPSSLPTTSPCPSTSGVVGEEHAGEERARRHRTVLIAAGFVASLAISTRVLFHPGSEVRAVLSTIGLVVMVFGLVSFAWGVVQKRRADRLIDARLLPTGALDTLTEGRPHGQVCVQGAVICDQPLYAPVTNRPCLYYRVRRVAVFPNGARERVLEERCFAAPFAIDDGTGRAWIDARNGGDFEPLQSSQSQTTSPDGTIYRVEEKVLPLRRSLFVCGRVSDEGVVAHIAHPGRPLLAIEPPDYGPMIISTRSRADLLREASKSAKVALAFSLAASVLGCTIATTGAPFSSESEESDARTMAPPATTTTTTTTTTTMPTMVMTVATPPVAAPPTAAAYEPPPPTTGVAPSPSPPALSPPPRRRGSSAHR